MRHDGCPCERALHNNDIFSPFFPEHSPFESCGMGFLGMTRTCTGAWGLTSWKARHWSSSNTMEAGISRRIIFPKIVSPPSIFPSFFFTFVSSFYFYVYLETIPSNEKQSKTDFTRRFNEKASTRNTTYILESKSSVSIWWNDGSEKYRPIQFKTWIERNALWEDGRGVTRGGH